MSSARAVSMSKTKELERNPSKKRSSTKTWKQQCSGCWEGGILQWLRVLRRRCIRTRKEHETRSEFDHVGRARVWHHLHAFSERYRKRGSLVLESRSVATQTLTPKLSGSQRTASKSLRGTTVFVLGIQIPVGRERSGLHQRHVAGRDKSTRSFLQAMYLTGPKRRLKTKRNGSRQRVCWTGCFWSSPSSPLLPRYWQSSCGLQGSVFLNKKASTQPFENRDNVFGKRNFVPCWAWSITSPWVNAKKEGVILL